MKKYMLGVLFSLSTVITILLTSIIMSEKLDIKYELIKSSSYKYIYYIKDEELIGVPVKLENSSNFELIEVYFEYLTSKSNSVGKEYYTSLIPSSELLSYEIKNEDLYLEVSDNFMKVDNSDWVYVIGQLVYSYQELGYEEIYIIHNKKIVSELGNIVLYNGVSEVGINMENLATTQDRKKVKITYYYKNDTKTFINYFINDTEDETKFKLNKIIDFLNTQYKRQIALDNFSNNGSELIVYLRCKDEDIKLIEKLLFNNFDINKNNLKITIIGE